MKESEIIEGNKLIAEFMGDTTSQNSKVSFTKNCPVSGLKYHSSWDWLMPVVEKIEHTYQFGTGNYCKIYISCNNDPKDYFYYCNIFGSEDDQFNGESAVKKITSVWFAVVEFIEWYNSQLH